MSKRVKVEGRIITVPDDATPDEIDAIAGGGAPKNALQDRIDTLRAAVNSYPKPGAEKPGFMQRFGEMVGIPTSMQALQQQSDENNIFKNPGTAIKNAILTPVGQMAEGYIRNVASENRQGFRDFEDAVKNTQGANVADRYGKGAYGVVRGAASIVPFGTQVFNFGQDVGEGNFRGAAGGAAGAFANVALAKAVSPKAEPLSTDRVAKIATDAVNPAKQSMGNFEKNLNRGLPEVVAKTGKIVSREQLAQAFENVGTEKYKAYYENYIKPVKDEMINVPDGFSGNIRKSGQYGENPLTTVSDLERRLATINKTLKPVYEKGGLQAQVQLGAESKVALTQEAAAINRTLNDYISKRFDIPPEQVQTMRGDFGAMQDVADKIRTALAEERHQINTIRNQPVNLDTSATGLAARGVERIRDSVLGRPADRNIAKAMSRYSPEFQPGQQGSLLDISQPPSARNVTWPSDQPVQMSGVSSDLDAVRAFQQRQLQNNFSRAAVKSANNAPPPPIRLSEAQIRAIEQAAKNRAKR